MKHITFIFFTIFPLIISAQNLSNKELSQIYRNIIIQYGDKSNSYLIRETTGKNTSRIDKPVNSFEKRMFSFFFEGPPIDSNYFVLFERYIELQDEIKNITDIIKEDSTKTLGVFTDTEYQQIFNNKKYETIRQDFGYREFHRRYPNCESLYTFSQIIVSIDNKYGICYMEESSASKAGFGALIFIIKINGNWQIKHWIELWIS